MNNASLESQAPGGHFPKSFYNTR
ncbi:hypothetical protein XAP412_50003 [Xanthomonas phaseoli pv. phaseoli]|uniref:Uncharacterized protein n=1 Tax=Xanthomonas campestris pv. phaseoli TaxID=317013 RepID=A0AB38DTX7_XANCH|nr:hypothetical protein XAP7430_100003 [Xanthomonas phaseoli pv. phaseoli]SON84866.1 hypothetical protein XAP6984_60003 [Xanthomonas phaseoli pv. phaseoli]SON86935.1 hypothetical protein XAP412_50003 [Xanthomonas phaseoli pv. phaseoli]